ncbi:MAG: MBL fold metallo-hydrolase [Actinomycetota bacterium]|nr:MBL fold metallo-hydrolase [Actinomycetota bacterium]
MGRLWSEIDRYEVSRGTLVLWWLYQAGIVVKSPGGTIVAVDPYVSDAVRRSYHLPRNAPALLDPAEVELDALLATHSHEDHLDPDSIGGFMGHGRTRFIGPPMAVDKVLAAGFGPDRVVAVARGDRVEVGDLSIRTVFARHEFGAEPTPDAVGFVLEHAGVSVYHSGDTEYDSRIVEDTTGVSLSLVPINGTTGNMNVHEAAMLAFRQGARTAVPFHYGLWRDSDYGVGATLDPTVFVDTYRRLKADADALVLNAGAPVVITSSGRMSAPHS